jgi:hypothetical protein
MIADPFGLTTDAPAPWSARNAIKTGKVGASAQATEATPNPTQPVTKSRR